MSHRWLLCPVLLVLLSPCSAAIVRSHGLSLFDFLKYPPSFSHFDWVNPQAPKGGRVRLMGSGSFDTLNAYTFKGTAPTGSGDFLDYGVTGLNEPLMVGTGSYDPSGDEPFASYGLIAESVDYDSRHSWIVFNLRPEARFHDGHPITAEDVKFSYQTLVRDGHPSYRTQFDGVSRVDILTPHRIRFVFEQPGNLMLGIRLGELPVLPQHYWAGRDFAATTFEPPLGSGPYRIAAVTPGKRLVFERVRDYWGRDLPVNRGKYNFDRVEVEFYRDLTVAFEAFKVGEFDLFIEHQAKNWANGYLFPAAQHGEIVKAEIPHQIPSPTQALFINTRNPLFQDLRVREALGLMLDFEWTNRTLFYGAYKRTRSYYPNSDFSAEGIPAGREWLLLSPFRGQLPDALFTQPVSIPETDGYGIPRQTLRKALALLRSAGWKLTADGLVDAEGRGFGFELLLVNPRLERIFQAFVNNLRRIGIQAEMRTVDAAQYKQRLDRYAFDMIVYSLPQGHSPGLEQWRYFHSSQLDVQGGRNYAGINNPVVDRLLEQLLEVRTREEQVATARALDRVLLWNHYIIPNWYISYHRVAYRDRFKHSTTPPYTLGIRAWWLESRER